MAGGPERGVVAAGPTADYKQISFLSGLAAGHNDASFSSSLVQFNSQSPVPDVEARIDRVQGRPLRVFGLFNAAFKHALAD